MRLEVKWASGVSVAGILLLGLGGQDVRAQGAQGQAGQPGNFRIAPAPEPAPVPPPPGGYQAGFQPPVYATPYYGTGPYGGYYNPYGGFMSGVADIYSSLGQYEISLEQAGILRQQKKQAMIDTRRKNFDEWLYERDRTPTVEDDRERNRIEQIRRARNDPPINEIWDGTALNTLLTATLQGQDQRGAGPSIPLDADTVKNLNVTSGATTGSVGLLRDGGKLKWPLPLTRPAYESERKRVNELAPLAYKQAASGQVQPDVLDGLTDAANNIDTLVSQNVVNLTPKEYSQGKSFVRELKGTVQALQDPSVANYFSKWVLKGNTVGEVVSEMNQKGLKFAPALDGGQAAYLAMYRGLVAYLSWDPSRPWDTMTK